jgi:hypothetical protein
VLLVVDFVFSRGNDICLGRASSITERNILPI